MRKKHPIVRAIGQLIFFLGRVVLSLRYKVKLNNTEAIDKNRPVLFLPNHQAVVDPMILVSHVASFKNIVPVITSGYYDLPIINKFFKNWGAVRVSDLQAGSRNTDVLKDIVDSTQVAFNHRRSIVIYPAGQITGQGYERILNKKSAYEIVKNMPSHVHVVGVRINGLWGSMWSKAPTGKSPNFGKSLLRGLLYTLSNLVIFMPRRKVSVEFVNITEECKKQALQQDRKGFNSYLENFYNINGTEAISSVRHFFFLKNKKKGIEESHLQTNLELKKNTIEKVDFPIAIEKGVNKIIAQKLDIDIHSVHTEANLINDLGADSLSIVEIITEIEKKFKIDRVSDIAGFNHVIDFYYLANAELQTKKSLPPCSFSKSTPFCDYVKIKNLNNIPTQFIDRFTSHKKLPFAFDAILGETTRKSFLLKACVVAEIIKKQCKEERIGIMLPALQSTSLLIISCYLAGKVPVMLNWTVGKKILEHCVEDAGVAKIFSASSFIENIKDKLPDSVIGKLVMMEKEVAKAGIGTKLKGAVKSSFPKLLINTKNINEIAVILFTSGSESLPKAVPLTHSNIVNDLKSTLSTVDFTRNEIFMGILPPFHSFGFTVLSILPLITGIRIAYFPDPTDAKGVVRTIQHTDASLLVAAPSFLKMILSHAQKEDLQSINFVVSGSEALGKDVKKQFDDMIPNGILLEGYGITECAPVLSLNLIQKQKEGSVGKVIADVECKIIDLENGTLLNTNKEGMICFRGKNIFNGYLNSAIDSPFIEINGEPFYKTGDLGYMDDEGYLFLTGRLKRFIKNGGEMISLPFLENILLEKYGDEDEKVLAIEGSDKCSPPKIVLFSTKAISVKEANDYLKEKNAPPLAKINDVILMENIPLLGTGKVDYKLLKEQVK
ncbi:AMP-binding protein [Labilibacter marinus]|uniref:AMP-binding protein n=1 Tax=Labilibacter marinus TaxID=1477105 RepID=UPI00094F7BD7|nr:AMP-binding protein [Labilibacter marinus]